MTLVTIVAVGVFATLMTDLWQVLLKQMLGLPPANWAMVGRWVGGLARGTFRHRRIADSPAVRGERLIGWAFHYAIGIVYAALFLWGLGDGLGIAPTVLAATVFAVATLAAPWLILQPALGLGVMAARAVNRRAIRTVTITTHLVFGLGLYAGAVAATG